MRSRPQSSRGDMGPNFFICNYGNIERYQSARGYGFESKFENHGCSLRPIDTYIKKVTCSLGRMYSASEQRNSLTLRTQECGLGDGLARKVSGSLHNPLFVTADDVLTLLMHVEYTSQPCASRTDLKNDISSSNVHPEQAERRSFSPERNH